MRVSLISNQMNGFMHNDKGALNEKIFDIGWIKVVISDKHYVLLIGA